jgi:hypothetical protein
LIQIIKALVREGGGVSPPPFGTPPEPVDLGGTRPPRLFPMLPPASELTIEVKGLIPVPKGTAPIDRHLKWRQELAEAAIEMKGRLGPLLFEDTAEFNVEIEYRLKSRGSDEISCSWVGHQSAPSAKCKRRPR